MPNQLINVAVAGRPSSRKKRNVREQPERQLSMSEPRIAIPQEQIEEFCRRHRIRKLALFGSVLRDDFGPASDVDVLVEFEPGHHLGFGFFDVEDELSALLGRTVDLNTPGFLSRYFREEVIRSAEVLYAA